MLCVCVSMCVRRECDGRSVHILTIEPKEIRGQETRASLGGGPGFPIRHHLLPFNAKKLFPSMQEGN